MTTITNKLETFIKTDKNREQILKQYNYTCFDCKQVKNEEDDLDVYILDINSKPHTILPFCKSCHDVIMRQEEYRYRCERNMIISKKNEKEYKEAKHRFRTSLRHAYDDMNTMIRILSEDNPGWSIKRIIKQILLENEDIGISMRSMYNHLDDQNRALVDPKYHHKPSQENIVIDNNGANLHHDIEDSSSMYREIEGTVENKELSNEEKEEKASKLLPKPIYEYAKEREISPDKMLMIANPRLAKHPPLQESLIDDVVTKSNNEAKNTVDQVIMDLETGALFKSGKSYHLHNYLRDKIDSRPEVEKSPQQYYFGFIDSMIKFLSHITGYKIVKGEYEYTEKHIEYTEKHRIEMIKALDERAVLALKEDLEVVRSGINSMLDIIDKEAINNKKDDD